MPSQSIYIVPLRQPPAKRAEQERLYEWCLIIFGELILNQSCSEKDGYDAIKKLKRKLTNTIKKDIKVCSNKL